MEAVSASSAILSPRTCPFAAPNLIALQRLCVRCQSYSSQAPKAYSSSLKVDAEHAQKVFCDDSKGIVCYLGETGEVVCEGLDEGPHFNPPSTQFSAKSIPSSIYMPDIKAAGVLPLLGEGMLDICVKEYMGSLLCEGKDES